MFQELLQMEYLALVNYGFLWTLHFISALNAPKRNKMKICQLKNSCEQEFLH